MTLWYVYTDADIHCLQNMQELGEGVLYWSSVRLHYNLAWGLKTYGQQISFKS